MIILGVDFGEARTGLAICDRSELLASPVGTPQKNGVQHVLWSAIPKI